MSRSGPRRDGPTILGVDLRELVAPGLAAIGLVLVGGLTLGLLTGDLPFVPGGGDSDGGPFRTPTPTDVVVVDPRADVPGTITFVKAGNVWIQRGDRAYQVTSSGLDSMPSWSPDGAWIYFVRETPRAGRARVNGVLRGYDLLVPSIMRVDPDSEAAPETILSGLYEKGTTVWSYFLRQPVVSPALDRLAVVSDGPDPFDSNVVLQLVDLTARTLVRTGVVETKPLGHQDPAWSPDGSSLLYVRNGRDGARGAPLLMRLDLASGTAALVAGPGYTAPSWSPDGRFIAATRTDGFGTDVIILEAATGIELLRLTTGGHSFSPAWSPAGDAVAYLDIDRGVVDMMLQPLAGSGPGWTLGEILPLTQAAGLDAASRPSWYIPPEELPKPTPSPTPPATPTPSGAPASPTEPCCG